MSRPLIVISVLAVGVGGYLTGRSVASAKSHALENTFGALASQQAPSGTADRLAYRELVSVLRKHYIDEMPSDAKLVSTSVRGMIAALGDLDSSFYDAKAFAAEKKALNGELEGIGVRLSLFMDQGTGVNNASAKGAVGAGATPEEVLATVPRVARLMVTAIAPDGPAAKAGVRIGDIVYSIDEHWLVNTDLLLRFRQAQRDFEAKKIPISRLNALRKELRDKIDRAMLPSKGRETLTVGTEGAVTVVWDSRGTKRTTKLSRGLSKLPETRFENGALKLNPTPDGLKNIPSSGVTTLDLRNGVEGDEKALSVALKKLAPAGGLGWLRRGSARGPVSLAGGLSARPKYRVLVDESTRGASQILARALVKSGAGSLVGKMNDASTLTELISLPDGSGYRLAVAKWEAGK